MDPFIPCKAQHLDLLSSKIPKLQEERKILKFCRKKEQAVFKGERIRLSLGLPCAALEAGRWWSRVSRLLERGGHSPRWASRDVTPGHCERKTFHMREDIKHTSSGRCAWGKRPLKFSTQRTVRAEILGWGTWRVQEAVSCGAPFSAQRLISLDIATVS